MMRPQVSRPVRYAVLGLVAALGAGLIWLGVGRLQAEKRAVAAAAVVASDGPAAGAAPGEQAKVDKSKVEPKAEQPKLEQPKVELLVHVTGAVASAGVFRLEQGARIADAITAAGGTSPEAMSDVLNLAARVQDGDKIHVPTVEEAKETPVPLLTPAKAPATASAALRPVSINTASAAELDRVTGVTPAVATAIVAYRTQNGPFRRLEDLTSVRGIGEKTLAKLRPLLTL